MKATVSAVIEKMMTGATLPGSSTVMSALARSDLRR